MFSKDRDVKRKRGTKAATDPMLKKYAEKEKNPQNFRWECEYIIEFNHMDNFRTRSFSLTFITQTDQQPDISERKT